MTWYAAKGEPRWDEDEVWTTMGHLYKGGMWFKKKSVLLAEGNYNTEKSVDGTDWRTVFGGDDVWPASRTLPSAADANKYFYLPALGYYDSGRLYNVGDGGVYWSSSDDRNSYNTAYQLGISPGHISIRPNFRSRGFRVGTFE